MILARQHDLINHNLLITGAAGRIGYATAELALSMGANVIMSDISRERLISVTRQIPPQFLKNVSLVPADITCAQSIKKLLHDASLEFGPVTSAVHSAYPMSKGWGTPFENLEQEYLYKDLSSQLGSAILFSQQMLRHFQENGGGSLIHISSIQGISAPKFEHYEGTEMVSPIEYSAIKSGIIAITRWLAKYYANQNIRINCVSPGGIEDGQPQIFLNKYRSSCTNVGMLVPSHIASTIMFLISSDSYAINGQNIVIDDGWSL